MDKKNLNYFLNFIVSLTIGLSILFFVFKDVDISSYSSRIQKVSYSWFLFAIFISLFEFVVRAYRWNLLLEFKYKKLSVYKTTLGLIISYLSAIILPRINDIVRCYVLTKTDKVKFSMSIGSVVTERIVDLISVFILSLILLLVEFDRFYNYLMIEVVANAELDNIVYYLVLIFSICIFLYLFLNKIFKRFDFYEKFKEKINEFKSGLLSIFSLEKKFEFFISTIILWLIYFVVGYILFFSVEETSMLGFSAALSILVAGAIGTIVPVNAGIGAYHLFVSSILIYYGIVYEDALFFATLVHANQVIAILFYGIISLILFYFNVYKRN